MRRALAAILFALAAATYTFGQNDAEAARRELDAGERAYRARKFAEAEQRFRRALELDPEAKDARLLVARAARQQYRPNLTTPENTAAGERAAAAYQEVIQRDPSNDDAYEAVVVLYGQMKREDKVNEWLLRRANEFSLPGEKRAEAFVALAARQWQCSYALTERAATRKPAEVKPESKVAESVTGDTPAYTMPADEGEFIKARECATEGTRLIDQALALDPKSPEAWRYKANLIREAAKLAEMEGDLAQKAEYAWHYDDAVSKQKRLIAEAARKKDGKEEKEEEEEAVLVAPVRMPEPAEPDSKKTVNGGVLNGKAVSKPMPAYPPEAKAAGAQGTVVVRIVVDEGGKVVEAEAVSGHPLLLQAAVTAARGSRFAPTRLAGQPVKVAGVITYNFVLQ